MTTKTRSNKKHWPTKALKEDRLDIFRYVEAGTNDPNIIGDAGPFDVPPGSDGRKSDLFYE